VDRGRGSRPWIGAVDRGRGSGPWIGAVDRGWTGEWSREREAEAEGERGKFDGSLIGCIPRGRELARSKGRARVCARLSDERRDGVEALTDGSGSSASSDIESHLHL
jgi:hypothetical protein